MCGFSGIVSFDNTHLLDKIYPMTEMINHRGPDDEGFVFINSKSGEFAERIHENHEYDIAFGFKRLAIIDLSKDGHQPFIDEESGAIIVFNGEIYNYIELRQELIRLGFKFHTKSDTEVLLKAYLAWDKECLNKFNGMWAFAIWDNKKREVFCARDRFGIKPFYYAKYRDGIIFGSEMKQILMHFDQIRPNTNALQRFFFMNNHPVQWCDGSTLFEGAHHLPPGYYMEIKDGRSIMSRYYQPEFIADKSLTYKGSFEDAKAEYLYLLSDAVRLRMRSDVAVGSALSGGLDSSAIVSIAVDLHPASFKTFTAYFDELGNLNERKWAELLNSRKGAQGHYVSPKALDMAAALDDILWKIEVPLPSSSLVAQYFVMKCARENGIKVMLDGQGADEIMAGYHNAALNSFADRLFQSNMVNLWRDVSNYSETSNKKFTWPKIIVALLMNVYQQRCLELKLNALKFGMNPASQKLLGHIPHYEGTRLHQSLMHDLFDFSIPNLLHYEDRNSMAHSVEARVPFLDYRLVEFSMRLPDDFKFNNSMGKYIHRQALRNIVPDEILDRKDKVAFRAPGENIWMREVWKEKISELGKGHLFQELGLFRQECMTKTIQRYLSGDNVQSGTIWKMVMIDQWIKRFSISV